MCILIRYFQWAFDIRWWALDPSDPSVFLWKFSHGHHLSGRDPRKNSASGNPVHSWFIRDHGEAIFRNGQVGFKARWRISQVGHLWSSLVLCDHLQILNMTIYPYIPVATRRWCPWNCRWVPSVVSFRSGIQLEAFLSWLRRNLQSW